MTLMHRAALALIALSTFAAAAACGNGGGTGGAGASSTSSSSGVGPGCKAGGATCAAFTECCSGSCANDVCTTCIAATEACGAGDTCCLGYGCLAGVCQPSCGGSHDPCLLAAECCSNVCTSGACEGDCTDLAAPCASDIYCCQGACDKGFCATCRSVDSATTDAMECCSGQAADGKCSCGTGTCEQWVTKSISHPAAYGELCGDAKKYADDAINCVCGPCGSACGGSTEACVALVTTPNTVPTQACQDCSKAHPECAAAVTACKAH
jgi:hypothetical protein